MARRAHSAWGIVRRARRLQHLAEDADLAHQGLVLLDEGAIDVEENPVVMLKSVRVLCLGDQAPVAVRCRLVTRFVHTCRLT